MSPDGLKQRWYAVQIRSNFEQVICAEFNGKGLENYCPAVREVHQWADRKKVMHRPLFPGYVFVRFADSSESRLRVLRTQGAVRLLGGRDTIEPVPDREIESIRTMLDSGRSCDPHPFLREGARVRVRRGALKNTEGILVRLKNEARLVVSISLFCKAVATEVNLNDVEAVRSTF